MTDHVMRPTVLQRSALAVSVLAGALWLAGCGSNVKLDDTNKAGGSAPVSSVPLSSSSSSGSSTAASSTVAPVVTAPAATGPSLADLPKVIFFDYDSFVVKEEFRPTVEGYAKALNAVKSKRLTVEGHTDDRGGREYNLALGQKRAEATVKSLTLLGVSGEQLEAVSFGKERPAAEGSNEAAWAKNRRAEFKGR
jgi:peptidoglycan-associated lipoprotein